MIDVKEYSIAVIGLGYVGLPLAVEFGKKYKTIGFDIQKERIEELNAFNDKTLEVANSELEKVIVSKEIINTNQNTGLYCTDKREEIANCNVFIITVPTPTDKHNRPVLTPLVKASESVGQVLKKGDIVVYESTVYPGATEEECVPVLEKISGLKFNEDFYAGYSPERINPGDKKHTVTKIRKVTSGSTPEIAEVVDGIYNSVIEAGTFKASTIKVAEAAKVIENSQRDINIAFVNELSKIFNRLDIDTMEVLEAARTKWNFLPFTPGLVGGHCIGVDPYYLAQKAQEVGYHPEIILAGRRLNDTMGIYIATEVIKNMIKKDMKIAGSKILMLGITFKENCPDIRNSKAIDIYRELITYDANVDVYDPWANAEEVKHEYDLPLITDKKVLLQNKYDGIILAVAHKEFLGLDLNTIKKPTSLVYDVKSFLPKDKVDARL
ncbi:nucleotide sugar dehydrogenase [uncultured Kordia sp.]|uniref:nucleotide sugar dehydrogenase n=1 Tax=uncultured Kordia sp. TaxID=507699 RepID=UPI002621F68A|nr:nucleotide sugar dehydrogenase [uncultured Kordia sp.]